VFITEENNHMSNWNLSILSTHTF